MDDQTLYTGDTVMQDPIQELEVRRFAPVSTGAFFGYKLLYGIPVIGWILCAVFAFTEKNVNKRNFARATLIGIVISLVITCLIGFAVVKVAEFVIEQVAIEALGGNAQQLEIMTDAVAELQSGKHDAFIARVKSGEFGDFPELGDLLDDLRDDGLPALISEFQSGDFEDVAMKFANGDYDELIFRVRQGEFGDMGALGKLLERLADGDASDMTVQ